MLMNRKYLPASLLMMTLLLFLMNIEAEAKEPVMAPRIEAPTLTGETQVIPVKGSGPFCILDNVVPVLQNGASSL